jgi:hypothetical protein
MDHTAITYFDDCTLKTTTHSKIPKIPQYVRVVVTDKKSEYFNKIGEVMEYLEQNDKYKVNLSNNDTAGFNNALIYTTATFQEDQLNPLDKGLNSPYSVNLQTFVKDLESKLVTYE